MNITVIGCGRWGSFLAWYLDHIGHQITLYGRPGSANLTRFLETRSNGLLELPASVSLTSDLNAAKSAEVCVISIGSQQLRGLMAELSAKDAMPPALVLCMKGLEIGCGKRLTEVVAEYAPKTPTAVWLGPGHVQQFLQGIPNCMVIDSLDEAYKAKLIEAFSSDLIRFYYGRDLIGNELGACAKNVMGIAAGVLDGLSLSSLKGPLMSRGTREIARLIHAAGGNELSAYGLCHLGDYEATLFSTHSNNRAFGEAFARGESFHKLAEGYYTVAALLEKADALGVELPICRAVYDALYEKKDSHELLATLFAREQKKEF